MNYINPMKCKQMPQDRNGIFDEARTEAIGVWRRGIMR